MLNVIKEVTILMEAAEYINNGEVTPLSIEMDKFLKDPTTVSLDWEAVNVLKQEVVAKLFFQQRTAARLLDTL